MKRMMRKMSGRGDEVVAEWNETTPQEELDRIEEEFNALTAQGYWAADVDKEEIIKEFDPNANILMCPRLVGG